MFVCNDHFLTLTLLFLEITTSHISALVVPGIENLNKPTKVQQINNYLSLQNSNCGEKYDNITKTFIVKGSSTKFGEFPWHVGIYRQQKTNDSDSIPEYCCGGSIISKHGIITVAHCFTNDDGKLTNYKYFAVAGKYHRNINAVEDVLAQKREVKTIHIYPKYKGILSSYAWDIAILILDEPFTLSSVIKPICIDWTSEFEDEHLKENSYGLISGWGFTKSNNESDDGLKVLTVPYVEHSHCTKVVPKQFIKYITQDKFCAGFQNGSSVCNGDSGGGLVFERSENNRTKYYIRGLVSVGVQQTGDCDSHQYTTYTKVSNYLYFIREYFPKIDLINANK